MTVVARMGVDNGFDHSVERRPVGSGVSIMSSLLEGSANSAKILGRSMSFLKHNNRETSNLDGQANGSKPRGLNRSTTSLNRSKDVESLGRADVQPELMKAAKPALITSATFVQRPVSAEIRKTASTLARSMSIIDRNVSDNESGEEESARGKPNSPRTFASRSHPSNQASAICEDQNVDPEPSQITKTSAAPQPYPHLVVEKKFTALTSFNNVRRETFVPSIQEDSVDEGVAKAEPELPPTVLSRPRPGGLMRSSSFYTRNAAPISEEEQEEKLIDPEPETQLVASAPQREPVPQPDALPVLPEFTQDPPIAATKRGALAKSLSFFNRNNNNMGKVEALAKPQTAIVPFQTGLQHTLSNNEVAVVPLAKFSSGSTQAQMLQDEIENLRVQVAELEKDRDGQRDLKLAFKVHAIRLGDALKSFREYAQARGVDLRDIDKTPSTGSTVKNQVAVISPTLVDDDSENSDTIQELLLLKSQAKECGWLIQAQEVKLQEQIGRGSTADIFKGVWRGLPVGVKCIRSSHFGENMEGIHDFCREVEVLSRQRHPYVLHMLAACLSPPECAWIVTEYLPAGTLTEWLHGTKTRVWKRVAPLPPLSERLRVATEISIAMQYLHEWSPKVIHRDLKPSNIFMDENHHVRIADFSFARYYNSQDAVLTGETGTYVYMAPEVMRHDCYDEKCDVYSFGIMLCEMVSGFPPYINTTYSPAEIACSVAQGLLRPSLPETQHPALIDLIMNSWEQDSAKRPSFAAITASLKSITKDLGEFTKSRGNKVA